MPTKAQGTAPETAVTKVGTQAVSTEVQVRRGFEELDVSSITMPTVKLLQPTSPEVTDEEFSDYAFKAGRLIHGLLLEELKDTFVPIIIKENKICFIPRRDDDKVALKAKVKTKFGIDLTDDDMRSKIVCRSDDNQTGSRFGSCSDCKLCEFEGSEKPFCNKNINVLAVFDEQTMPLLLRFTSTSHKHGRKFKELTYFSGGDLFARKYKIVPVKKAEGGKTWYELTVKPFGKLEKGSDELKMAEALYTEFSKYVVIDAAEEHAPDDSGTVASEF